MQAFWELTYDCNLDCRHCYNEKDIQMEYNNQILNKIIEMKIKNLIIAGGEPLLCKEIYIILEALYIHNAKYTIITNGTLINEEFIYYYKRYGGTEITLSIDGTKEIHDYIRGQGIYNKVINNIKKLIMSKIIVNITFTANKVSYASITKMANELFDLGIKSILVNTYIPIGKDQDKILMLNYKELNELKDLIETIENKKKVNFSLFHERNNRCDCINLKSSFITIKPNGDILLCPHLPIVVANILNDNKDVMWRKIIKFKMHNLMYIPKKCDRCVYNKICMGGCRAVIYNLCKNFKECDLQCEIINKNI